MVDLEGFRLYNIKMVVDHLYEETRVTCHKLW